MGNRGIPSIPLRIATGILYFLLFVTAFCEDVLAQSNPAPPAQSIALTLKEAVQLALKKNRRLWPCGCFLWKMNAKGKSRAPLCYGKLV